MALPMLAGSADCGPLNPLQGLSKELDRDRGLQQDQFRAPRAGSSKQAFRSQYAAAPDHDAARFFAPGPAAGPSSLGAAPYDLSALHTALPPLAAQSPAQSPPASAAAPWAADFMQLQPPPAQILHSHGFRADAEPQATQSRPPAPLDAGVLNSPLQAQQWERAFQVHEEQPAAAVQEQRPAARGDDPDDLARAAASLIDAVRHEQNPKFQNSAFLGLMKQLRDREVVIEGNQVVPTEGTIPVASSWAADFQADVKGKGRAVELPAPPPLSVDHHHPGGTPEQQIGDAPAMHAAEEIDEYLRQENDAYINYWHTAAPPQSTEAAHGTESWDRLQRDWDRFEATATGIRPMAHYQFQANNPYLLGETSRHHMMHAPERNTMYDSVLEMEAAAQRSPTDAHAWFQLGVKQQENEREGKAVQALRRALELEPAHLPSWLALAISHTNEGNRQGACEAIREWVGHNARYGAAVGAHRAQHPERGDMGQADRFNDTIACLIAMARSDASGAIDADIQIALAVLMNTNEEYEKAKDCFTTALAVRPEDWQLYNRVGATLANSGRPGEALDYYYRALELNPAYIRARFNLGISCINLRRYEEASQHILDALSLQESDRVGDAGAGEGGDDRRGITSSALWDSLKTCCLHLGRLDLATLCDRRDLDAFRLNFHLR
ncbi:hypothetical protein PHLGIDRAFT_25719 [Phlebiopsis gigantea 11061_1 CR5-6]|uniref:Uncharacterized protein n=1 Tax=Phlebiopsis gigantea (strain 11061_1 CR5-6) TaxID=745531 RepID=A0A0C3RTS8_PHLG1|nr:hypothetical protein PHLGIDRAFT_25719 [Phlebiopsis gigantea 11061_1 CR5-6]